MQFAQALKEIATAFPKKPDHIQRLYAGLLRDTDAPAKEWISGFKARLSAAAKADRDARTLFRERLGKYRIEASDAVSVYGIMPNTNICGWYLYADTVERAIERLTPTEY